MVQVLRLSLGPSPAVLSDLAPTCLSLSSRGFHADGQQRQPPPCPPFPPFLYLFLPATEPSLSLCGSEPRLQHYPKSPGEIIICKMAFIGRSKQRGSFTRPHFSLINTSQLGSARVQLGPLTTGFSSTGILGTRASEVYFCQGEVEHFTRRSPSHISLAPDRFHSLPLVYAAGSKLSHCTFADILNKRFPRQ